MRAPYAAPTDEHIQAALGNSSVSAALRRLVQSRGGDDPPERSGNDSPKWSTPRPSSRAARPPRCWTYKCRTKVGD
jgi:hypothetical protein